MPTPVNKKLYDEVKADADKKFLAPTSVYKSAWIVAEYKRRGGLYREDGSKKGLTQWFKEKWVDLGRPKKDSKGNVVGYEECGRDHASVRGTYPLCRPSKRVNKSTPKTVGEIDKKKLPEVEKAKQKVKHKGRVNF
jgi:hypothetical protein